MGEKNEIESDTKVDWFLAWNLKFSSGRKFFNCTISKGAPGSNFQKLGYVEYNYFYFSGKHMCCG